MTTPDNKAATAKMSILAFYFKRTGLVVLKLIWVGFLVILIALPITVLCKMSKVVLLVVCSDTQTDLVWKS